MDRNTFNQIVSNQTEISSDKDIVKYYKKVNKICGFLNLRGYDTTEHIVRPVREYGEIRLVEKGNTYSNYIRIDSPIRIGYGPRTWYGLSGNYLIFNNGSDCQTVFELMK